MKKLSVLLFVFCLLTLLIGGCGGTSEKAPSSAPESAVQSSLSSTTESGTTTVTFYDPPPTHFTVAAHVRVRDETFENDFSGQLVTSRAQLDALQLSEENDTEKYTDAFFADKALAIAEIRLTSGSIRLNISTIIVKSDRMTVYYRTTYTEPFTQDMAYWRVFIELDKDNVKAVKYIVGNRTAGGVASSIPSTTTTVT